MSRLAVIKDPRFENHRTPQEHPESPLRVRAINEAIDSSKTKFSELTARLATEDDIATTHSDAYLEDLIKAAEIAEKTDSLIGIDPDTVMSPESFQTAKLAVGASLEAIDSVSRGDHDSCFVAVRPPGHHALADRAMGFCLFNNVAIAANYALKKANFKRVFILDWDVHHGNGTQDIFYNTPEVMFASIHQYPFWPPGSGSFDECGKDEGEGFNLNIPLPAGTGDTGYLKTLDSIIVPACRQYNPDLIIVSAGYDAHQDDPIASQRLTTVGFAMMAQRVADLRDHTGAKIVCLLEGGYNTSALAKSTLATMEVLNASTASELGEVHASYMVQNAVIGNEPVTDDYSANQVEEMLDRVKTTNSKYRKL